jgi:hypothetical protein
VNDLADVLVLEPIDGGRWPPAHSKAR